MVVTLDFQIFLMAVRYKQLVVHDDVVFGRIPGFHIGQLALFVHIDEGVPVDCSKRPERSTLRGWNTTSPSVRRTTDPQRQTLPMPARDWEKSRLANGYSMRYLESANRLRSCG